MGKGKRHINIHIYICIHIKYICICYMQYNGILFSPRNEINSAVCDNMNESLGHLC